MPRLFSFSSSSDCLIFCVFPDASAPGDARSRVTESSQSPSYRIRTESEQVSLFSQEQSSLHESEGLLLPSVHLLFSNSHLRVLQFFTYKVFTPLMAQSNVLPCPFAFSMLMF